MESGKNERFWLKLVGDAKSDHDLVISDSIGLKMGSFHGDSVHLENWAKIVHCPTSSGASERASERANE